MIIWFVKRLLELEKQLKCFTKIILSINKLTERVYEYEISFCLVSDFQNVTVVYFVIVV